MEMIELVLAEIQRLLELQLAAARRAHRPVVRSTAKIVDAIEDFGMGKGFVPVEPLTTKPGFRGATIVIAFCDYETEATVTV